MVASTRSMPAAAHPLPSHAYKCKFESKACLVTYQLTNDPHQCQMNQEEHVSKGHSHWDHASNCDTD